VRWGFPKGRPILKRNDLEILKARFGKVVLRRRLEAKLGQDEFAEKAGMHRTTLSALERGKHLPNLDLVHRVAKAFGVKMAVLVSEAEDEKTPLTEPPALPKGRPRKKQPTDQRPGTKKK
jgi:transcriptional regulator with XRE-family HTH domain